MATNHTTNYQLCQWEAADQVLRADFNEDNQKIDTAIWEARPKFAIGSYTGTGEFGADHPNTLTFEFEPQVVMVFSVTGGSNGVLAILPRGAAQAQVVRQGQSAGSIFEKWWLTWAGNQLSWYATWINNDENTIRIQGNTSGAQYYYIALA